MPCASCATESAPERTPASGMTTALASAAMTLSRMLKRQRGGAVSGGVSLTTQQSTAIRSMRVPVITLSRQPCSA